MDKRLFLLDAYALILLISARRGQPAGANPWGGGGLEWSTSSPPPAYNFGRTPVVEGREPLWLSGGKLPLATGLAKDTREVLLTTLSDAAPDTRLGSPEPSVWPLLTAIAVTLLFTASVFNEWALVWFSPLATLAVLGWFWPRPSHSKKVGEPPDEVPPGALA